ncbi:MAG: ABC transporter permease [Terracidiphilus sp.]|nr:ABC transporter permease [Terracidiphilus sp.]
MRNILLIAKREYLEQVRGRAFRLSTALVPLLLVVIVGIIYVSGRGVDSTKHVVIASSDALLAADMRTQLLTRKDAKFVVDVTSPATPEDRAALVQQVKAKAINGFLWIETAADKEPAATYVSTSSGDFITDSRLGSALNRALVRERLAANGVQAGNVEALLKNVEIETRQVSKEGMEVKSNAMTSFYKGYLMAFLLSMTTVVYGLNVARSIIQEKTSRIFEVMLAIAKPGDMLAGKLIGVGAVGLTQIAIWTVAAAAIAGSALAEPILSGTLSIHFSWVEGVLFPVYFVLGYLLYAALFAGLAATCETEQELQMYTPLAALPVWLSFALIVMVVNNPDSLLSVAASLFPATAPIIMMLRMGSQMPPVWQFVASIALLALSIWGVLWFSTRLYRVGILMYGKRATLPEILRWLRYS